MSIEDGKLITFKHTIVDQDGRTISVSRRKTLFKQGSMHDKLYEAIKPLNVGESVAVEFSKAELGTHQADKVITLPRHQFSAVPNDHLEKGMLFKTRLNNITRLGYVSDFDDDTITLDTNSALLILNKDLTFHIELEHIDVASEEVNAHEQYNYSDLLFDDNQAVNVAP